MEINGAVKKIAGQLRVSTAKIVGEVWFVTEPERFKDEHSARVQAQKHLNLLAETGQLVRGQGWYATPSYRGTFKDHDRLLTQALSDILKLKLECIIHREVAVEPAMRADAAVLLARDGHGICFLLEVAHREDPAYTAMKINQWRRWPEANDALAKLFGYRIPHFSIIVSRNQEDDEFNQFLRRIR